MIAARVRQATVGLRPPSACLTRHRTKRGADISIVWAGYLYCLTGDIPWFLAG